MDRVSTPDFIGLQVGVYQISGNLEIWYTSRKLLYMSQPMGFAHTHARARTYTHTHTHNIILLIVPRVQIL